MGPSRKILLIDDSTTSRAIVRHLLAFDGHEVLEAEDGHAALALLKAGLGIEIVLCDVNMPEMSGVEVLEQLDRLSLPCKPAVFLLTANLQRPDSVRMKRLGARGYFTKPLKKAQFDQALEAL